MATFRQTDPMTSQGTHGGSAEPPPNATAMTAAALNFLLGVWLFVSYWILDYSSADPGWNALVFGAVIAVLALLRLTGVSLSWVFSAANAAVGVWLVISAFTLADSGFAIANFVACGGAVFVFATFGAATRWTRTL